MAAGRAPARFTALPALHQHHSDVEQEDGGDDDGLDPGGRPAPQPRHQAGLPARHPAHVWSCIRSTAVFASWRRTPLRAACAAGTRRGCCLAERAGWTDAAPPMSGGQSRRPVTPWKNHRKSASLQSGTFTQFQTAK